MKKEASSVISSLLDKVYFSPIPTPSTMPRDIDEDEFVNSNYSDDENEDVDLSNDDESEMDASDTEDENDFGSNTENEEDDDDWDDVEVTESGSPPPPSSVVPSKKNTNANSVVKAGKSKRKVMTKKVISDSDESDEDDGVSDKQEKKKTQEKPESEIKSCTIIKPQSLVTIVNGKAGTKNTQAYVLTFPGPKSILPKSLEPFDENKKKKFIDEPEFQHTNLGYVVIVPIAANPDKVNEGRIVACLFIDNKRVWSLNATNELKLWKKQFKKEGKDAKQAKLKEIVDDNNKKGNSTQTILVNKKHFQYTGFYVSDALYLSLKKEQERTGKKNETNKKTVTIRRNDDKFGINEKKCSCHTTHSTKAQAHIKEKGAQSKCKRACCPKDSRKKEKEDGRGI